MHHCWAILRSAHTENSQDWCEKELLHHDNAPSYKSTIAIAKFHELSIQMIPHSPYSSDFTPVTSSRIQTSKFNTVVINSHQMRMSKPLWSHIL